MVPVEQTKFGKEGDCMRACVASIFEVPLDAVPEFSAGGGWNGAILDWLKARNLSVVSRPVTVQGAGWPFGHCILIAGSPRTGGFHAVVLKDGEIVHDPHPQREQGVGKWEFYIHFCVIDPSRILKQQSALQRIATRRPSQDAASAAFYRCRKDAQDAIR